jgi:glucosyl-3-phosphoglycerate synthase
MINFSQKCRDITTLYLVDKDQPKLGPKLRAALQGKKAILVIPTLATEFTDEENRPVFKNILKQLSKVSYLRKIIFGLDAATDAEALELAALLEEYGIRNYILQHNEGERFRELYKRIDNLSTAFRQPGKGRNMFMSFGIAQAIGANYVGVIDADIRTFHHRQLDRLFYPIIILNYQFSKAAYMRIGNNRMYGRVKRLLLDPFLLALKRKFRESEDEKFISLIDYLLAFNYQLSGEVAFEITLLKRMHFATNWGVELFTLIEAYRKANNIAQVQFSPGPFEHKHQPVSTDDPKSGLFKMSTDIVTTLLSTLVIEEGFEISDYFVRDITATYLNIADELIKKYSENASFSNLEYDRDAEEAMVKGVFRDSILAAGEFLTSSHRFLSENLLHLLVSDKRFERYKDAGLVDDLLSYEEENKNRIFEIPQTVSWERIIMKQPGILNDIRNAVEKEMVFFANAR